MDRGTYVAASGGLLQFRKLEVVNNNLANINTPGFKKEILVGDQETFDETLASITAKDPYARGDHDRSPGTVNVRAVTDFTPGPVENTGNTFDVALRNANDFFVINGANGAEYTRAGNFTLSIDGQLTTKDGAQVLGDGGSPITITGANVAIAPSGAVTVNGKEQAKLQVARITNPQNLVRAGNSRFVLPANSATPENVEPDVIPQSLERSNVSAINGVIDLILTERAFQAYTKTAESIDTMNQSAINQVGKRT